MPDSITNAHIRAYKDRFEHLLQQKESRLKRACSTDTYTGESAAVVEQVGPIDIPEMTTRHADTPLADIVHTRPWVFPKWFPQGILLDQPDKLKALVDFQNPYAEALAQGINRAVDIEILRAAGAPISQGKNPGDTTEVFDVTNQQIAAGGVGLTVAKLIQAKEILMANEVDEDEEMFCVTRARQVTRDLLNDTLVTSSDYNEVKALVRGQVNSFMGFTFIQTELVPLVGADVGVFCFAKSGLHCGDWMNRMTEIDQREDKSYLWQIFVQAMFGATRTQGGKVVRILANIS